MTTPRDPHQARGEDTPAGGIPVARPADEPDRESVPAQPDPAVPAAPEAEAPRPAIRRTRISGVWVAVIVAVIVLIFLLVFILQNLASATVQFLGAAGTLPLGVAMLLAAVAGALLVALVGTARVLQLRRHARRLGSGRRRD